MRIFDTIKFKIFTTRVKWTLTGAVTLYRDSVCIIVNDVIIYKGENHDAVEEKAKRIIRIKDDESGLMRNLVDDILMKAKLI